MILSTTLLGPSLMRARPYHLNKRPILGTERLATTVCETPRYPEYSITQRRRASLVSPSDKDATFARMARGGLYMDQC